MVSSVILLSCRKGVLEYSRGSSRLAVHRNIRLASGDHGLLLSQHDGFAVPLRRAQLANVDLLLEDQLSLDDDNLLQDRHDRDVALLASRRRALYPTADRHTCDLDPVVPQLLL